MAFDELIFWAENAAWFQYRDECGRVRTSCLGNCDSVEGLAKFCQRHEISFQIFQQRPQDRGVSSHERVATRSSAAGKLSGVLCH